MVMLTKHAAKCIVHFTGLLFVTSTDMFDMWVSAGEGTASGKRVC